MSESPNAGGHPEGQLVLGSRTTAEGYELPPMIILEMPRLEELIERWRADEDVLRKYKQESTADALRRRRRELRAWWQEQASRELTTHEAEALSGYSRSALEQMRGAGKITAAGEPGAPRYVASELPLKPRKLKAGEPDLAGVVLQAKERAE